MSFFRLRWLFILAFFGSLHAQTWVNKVSGSGLGDPLTFNPLRPDVLYGSAFDNQIHVSWNRGYTWSSYGTGIPGGGVIKSIAINPLDTSQVLCGVKGSSVDKIFKSTNRGMTWTQTLSGSFSYFGKPVEFKPSHPDTAYTMSNDSLFRSVNFGSSWTLVRTAVGFNAWCDAELHPSKANVMLLGDYSSGIWKTTDYGATWYKVYASSGDGEIPSISFDPFNTNTLYASRYSDGGGIIKSTDGGETWSCIPTPIKTNCGSTNGGNGWWVSCSPVDPGYVYFGTYGANPNGIYISRDSGASWSVLNSGLAPNGILNYGLLVLDSLTVIALQEDGIYKLQYPTSISVTSPSSGSHWKVGSTHNITWNASALYAVKIQLSTDGGSTWSTVADSLPAGPGSYSWTLPHVASASCRIRILDRRFTSTADTSDLFEIFRTPPVLNSPAGGESWEAGSIHSIAWTSVPDILSMNLFFSSDSGTHWSAIATQTASADTFHWTVPNAQSAQCLVKIADATDSVSADTSGAFSIFATQLFTCPVRIADNGVGVDTLTFGNQIGGTDGIDTLYESPLGPSPPPGSFDARWLISPTPGTRTDIRDTLGNGPTQHLFTAAIQPGPGGYPFSLAWNPEVLRTNTFVLRDTLTHGVRFNVDMRRDSSASLADTLLKALEILECQGLSFTISLNPGWNLVSLPAVVGNRRVSALFPDRTSALFSYAGQYKPVDTMAYATGYWIKSPLETITGCPLRIDTIDLRQGWNLIGIGSSGATVSSIQQLPPGTLSSQFFGYNGAGYVIATLLAPGRGYWIKARNAGRIVLDSTVAAPKSEGDANRLTLSDGLGHSQDLFFGSRIDPSTFDMPPGAPDETFEASFAPRRMAENISKITKSAEIPINLRSSGKKIFLSWDVDNERNFMYILVEKFPGSTIEVRLSSQGSTVIPYDPRSTFALKVFQGSAEVPDKYSLGVYPNPFNPEAHLNFSVPSRSYVKIRIYSVLGEEVATLVDGERSAGAYTLSWNGSAVSSGTYFVQMTAGPVSSGVSYSVTQKLILLK